MSWVVLCIAQVSVFRKEGSAWVPAGFDVGDEWRPAEFSRNDTNGCKINIRNSESRSLLELNLVENSKVKLKSKDFAVFTGCVTPAGTPELTEYGFYFINEDEANLYTSFVLNTLGVLHPSASDIPGNAGNRRSLSLFPEVNSAVKSTIEKGDGDYSQSVEQQQSSLLSRLTSSATGVFKMISSGSRQPSLNRMPSSQNSPSGEVSPASRSFSSGFAGNSDNMSPAAPSAGAHPEGEHISNPIAVRHDLKVEYDSFNARYKGLPSAWESMNKSFGLPYEMSQKVAVEGYESRIPATLEMLKRYFLQYEGQNAVGVFRLSANKDEVDLAKQQIDTGQFNGCEDVHIIANLIKIYFRDMSKSLLNNVPEKSIHKIAETEIVEENEDAYAYVHSEMDTIEEPHKSLFFWLLDLMALVTLNENVNKMSCRNIAIVLSPNLYSVNTENAMFALTMSQKVADFTTKCLAARLQLKYKK